MLKNLLSGDKHAILTLLVVITLGVAIHAVWEIYEVQDTLAMM